MSLILADGHNLLFKAYSVPFKFKSNRGTPLHVATTFLSMLRKSVNVTNANQAIVVFDAPAATTNHALLPEYKANRTYDYSAQEDSPFDHLPIIKQTLDALGIVWIETPGTEADDIVATLSQKYLANNPQELVYILSTDTDFLQLVCEQIKIIKLLPKSQHQLIDVQYVVDNFGVEPSKFVELKCWVGDKADNIAGINGIGWKRAAEIMLGKRTRELSEAEQAILALNRQLIKLNCELDIAVPNSASSQLLTLSNQQVFDIAGL
jgi:DNA polymerase-1